MTGLEPGGARWADSERSDRRRAAAIIMMLLVFVLAGCGGSDTGETDVPADNPTTTIPSEAQTTTAPEPSMTTTQPPVDDPGPSVGVSTATVTVGDETYSFGATGFITERCNPDFFGGAQIILQLLDVGGEPLTVGEQMVFLDIALIPNDPSSTAVNVPTPEPDREWIADSESMQVSGTSVDEWSIDGASIVGSATFASTAGEGPVPGTFEVVCAEE